MKHAKHTKHIRIVLIPGHFDNLREVRKRWTDIPEFEIYNFASNLTCFLQERVFQTDKELREYIIANFAEINYVNPCKIAEVRILGLPDFYDEAFLGNIHLDSNFLSYCEVNTIGDLSEDIRFEITDFESYIDLGNYDTEDIFNLCPINGILNENIENGNENIEEDDLPL